MIALRDAGSALARLGHWLLPAHCLVCGAAGMVGRDLCSACHADLPWNDQACARCALPLPRSAAACGICLASPPCFEAAVAPLRYEFPADRLLIAFKFSRGLAQGRLLAELVLEAVCAPRDRGELVVPIPLHRDRLARRGYNQALELARPLAREWRLDIGPAALRRNRPTAPQSDLDASARRRNLKGAFVADAQTVRGRRVILVDDVVTTGTTVREAAATLIAAGAAAVRVVAASRASRDRLR